MIHHCTVIQKVKSEYVLYGKKEINGKAETLEWVKEFVKRNMYQYGKHMEVIITNIHKTKLCIVYPDGNRAKLKYEMEYDVLNMVETPSKIKGKVMVDTGKTTEPMGGMVVNTKTKKKRGRPPKDTSNLMDLI